MLNLRKTFHCYYTTSPDDEDQYRVKNMRLASCHLVVVVVLILADVSVAAISLSAKRSMNLVDNVGSQFQIRPHSKHSYGIFQPLDFSYTSTSYCCLIVPPIDY